MPVTKQTTSPAASTPAVQTVVSSAAAASTVSPQRTAAPIRHGVRRRRRLRMGSRPVPNPLAIRFMEMLSACATAIALAMHPLGKDNSSKMLFTAAACFFLTAIGLRLKDILLRKASERLTLQEPPPSAKQAFILNLFLTTNRWRLSPIQPNLSRSLLGGMAAVTWVMVFLIGMMFLMLTLAQLMGRGGLW